MELTDLQEYPFTGQQRPFSWHMSEPEVTKLPTHRLASTSEDEAFADLKLCMYLYMMHRRKMYVNYMAGGKNLFSVFFTSDHPLRGLCPQATPQHTDWLTRRHDWGSSDWTPHYEIQRLWIATRIHWSWLELAWYECEAKLWKSGQEWMLAKLERVSPTWELEQ
jgi:hypothetical protein